MGARRNWRRRSPPGSEELASKFWRKRSGVLWSCSSWIQQVQVWIGCGCSTPRLVEEHTTSTARDCHWCWWRYDFGRANGGIVRDGDPAVGDTPAQREGFDGGGCLAYDDKAHTSSCSSRPARGCDELIGMVGVPYARASVGWNEH
ncbi:hypothetical protein M6B38_172900 [Iris pallida]|uniref:Uncharacterized protein n=1 Tax=Iris pallida TaxID=29817 RepID=A0AAX6ETA1_IRIPA|nr:hypothetical protein M6B38_172900 [Iris pallida]